MTTITNWKCHKGIEYKVVNQDGQVLTYSLMTDGNGFIWYDSENDFEEVLACGTNGVCCTTIPEAIRRMEAQVKCLGWEDCGSNWQG